MAISIKAIHLHQNLIESIIPLIMGAVASTSFTTNSINLINEDD